MTPEAYQSELKRRGFTFIASCGRWSGPFGITVTGVLNEDGDRISQGRAIDHAFARASQIMEVDERLRAKRGTPRGPLVEPVKRFDPVFQPYIQIQDPGAYPTNPLYPPHQKNLPPPPPKLPPAKPC